MVVCLACGGVALLLIASAWLGISPYITTTLIGALVFGIGMKTDDWLKSFKEKRYAKKHNISLDEAVRTLAKNYKTSYIPLQSIVLITVLLIMSFLTYYWMGIL